MVSYGLENRGANEVNPFNCTIRTYSRVDITAVGGTHLNAYEIQVPAGLDYLKAEFACEVNIASRTILFLINGELVHDGDIPLPLSQEELQQSEFFVRLCEPGDCVRIID